MPKIGIIGTTGLNDTQKISGVVFGNMVTAARLVLQRECGIDLEKDEDVVIVSGGMAGAEHVAVRLWLDSLLRERKRAPTLQLFLPAPWTTSSSNYKDVGGSDWKTNPGCACNSLHRDFSGTESLKDLATASLMGAEFVVRESFAKRNSSLVSAAVDVLLCFTWAQGKEPESGLSKTLWDQSKAPKKLHLSLSALTKKNFFK